MSIHWVAAYSANKSFIDLVYKSLILVDTYAYFPQLAITIERLLLYYKYLGWVSVGLVLPLVFFDKKKWIPALVFILFFNAFFIFKEFNFQWFDVDLYYQSLSVLVVLLIGITVGIITSYFKIRIPDKGIVMPISLLLLFSVLLFMAFKFNPAYKNQIANGKEELKGSILEVYNKLSYNNLPYSYGVVNQNYGQFLATSEHHFINYKSFTTKYLVQDSIFQLNKNNKIFLKNNPKYILPSSVFVFVSKPKESTTDKYFETLPKEAKDVLNIINALKRRKRDVQVFFTGEFLTVYEIINNPKSSNFNDLIINL